MVLVSLPLSRDRTMKAIVLEAFGKLEAHDLPTPVLDPGQVLMRTCALHFGKVCIAIE
jgi:hypothetical protein